MLRVTARTALRFQQKPYYNNKTGLVVLPRIIFSTSNGSNQGNDSSDKESGNDPKVLFTVPNAITITRIIASPGISYLILHEQWNAALAGVCLAGASDVLDGFIARNYNQMSALGSILDPLADKLLVGAVALPLAMLGHLPMWLLGITLARDLGLCAGFVWLRSYGVASTPQKKIKHVLKQGMEEILPQPSSVPEDVERERMIEVLPSQLSKVNTGLQVTLLSLTLANAGWQVVPEVVLATLTCATATTTVLSAVDYYINASKVMKIKEMEK